ncbi:hypothetical protein [Flavobacterium collinsii]|jgi:hypothetical protein|uniref:Uncharacterized protein n=1 Tax=Flavobacterium collinsii TaxID=1114861 RepID=A0ABM8KH16_9FLAO|nr:hypothetical protein [Flavobacterium collinsii]CAA9197289.1 hypothetical protein FLACOL7796_01599 [Flavobacterium collinsii]
MKSLKNAPQIILNSKHIGHPIDFTWSKKKMEKFLDPLEGNEDLENILSNINHKATVGLTAALLEWIYWRFIGQKTSINDTEKRIEALWCSIKDPELTTPLLFDTNFDIPASGAIDGPLWVAHMTVRMIDVRYRKGSYFLQNEVLGLVLLARHVTPKRKVFDKWFNTTLIQLNHLYPSVYRDENLDETDEKVYDSCSEPLICRDFFFNPKFQYTITASEKAAHKYIQNLDHKANQFLHLSRKVS